MGKPAIRRAGSPALYSASNPFWTKGLFLTKRRVHRSLLWGLTALCLAAAVRAQDDEEDAFKLARNLYKDARDYATATELFAEFIRNYPDSQHLAEARLALARAYQNSGRCAQAIPAYESFYQEHPEHLETAAARRQRAACLAAEGSHLEAARAFEEVQRRFSASEFAAQVLLDAAVNYTHAENPEQAVRTYRKLIAEYSDQPQVHLARYRLAELLFAGGQPEAAQRLLAEITSSEPPVTEAPSALLLAGRIDLFLGNQEIAIRKFTNLQQRFAASSQADSAFLEQASYLYVRRQFTQAGDAFQIAHRQIKATELKKRALLGLADSRRQSRQTEQALDHYLTLLKELAPDHSDYLRARLGLAITYGQAGQFALAVGLFQELIQAGPDLPETLAALRELGTLYQERGDYTRGISWYRRYLQEAGQASDRNQVEFVLAGLYAASGDYEEAIGIYRRLATHTGPLAAEAQLGLARAFEQGGLLRPALREYVVLLEQFPASRHARTARERIEYLREFSVMDAEGLNRALQQAWIDELSGRPRQLVQLDVARALYAHHDFANAVRAFEHYAAAHPGGPYSARAQYFLAESLLKLAHQRQLEGLSQKADSLRRLALQEYRILVHADGGEWTQKAELQLVDIEAMSGPDSLHHQALARGFAEFLERHPDSPQRDRALLKLADARRQLSRHDDAVQAYQQLRRQFPDSPLTDQALFGLGLCRAFQGESQAAVDSLEQILVRYPNSDLAPWALFELGQILLRERRLHDAIARYQELRWAYPTFPQQRAAQLQLGDVYYQLQDYAEAIVLYRQLLEGQETGDQAGRIWLRLARAYPHQGEFAAGLEAYRRVLEQNLPSAALDSIYFSQAVLLVQLNQQEEAIPQFLRVRDDFADSPLASQAAARAAHLLFSLERYERAYQLYQPLLAEIREADVYGQAVLSLFRLQRLEEARKKAKNFTKRFAEDQQWPWRFQLEEGHYYLGKKNYERALKIFRQLEKQEGEIADNGAYYAAMALWEQNAASPSPESAARALEAQTRFIEEHAGSPHAADVYLRLGNYHFSLHNYLQAAGTYKRVLERPGTEAQAQEAVWQLLKSYLGAHEYDEAHKVAELLLSRFPDHPRTQDARLEIGFILKEKGQYARAIDQLESVLEWAEGNPASEARFYIGESYQNMGEYRKAIEAYYRVGFHGAGGSSQWITSADYKRAQCHESLNEYATAINVYQRIVQREGSDSPFGELASERIEDLQRQLKKL